MPALVGDLTRQAEVGRWYTTQENAFAFLALGKISRTQAQANYTGRVLVDGQEVASFDEANQRFASTDWGGQAVTLDLDGAGRAYYFWRADGLPSTLNVDEYDNDLVVRRRFLTEHGTALTD